ncbi:amidohydrolase family protein [Chloroflexota bacterium]
MKKIAIEEHFFTESYLDYLRSREEHPRLESAEDENHNRVEHMWRSPVHYTVQTPQGISALLDIGPGRLVEMDRVGINIQVLSMASPGVDELDVPAGTTMASKTNDELAQAIQENPERFAGFAAIAPGDPTTAAQELERAIRKLGLKGAKINSNGRGEYLDDKKYWALFEKAEELGAPIYIHPKEPPQDMLKFMATYPFLTGAGWGYGAEAGLHAMRLICSGLFDAYPRLKIILGHMGEAIPFWLWRIDNIWQTSPLKKKLKKNPGDYFKDNFWVTTSGMFSVEAFLCTYLTLGADRIIFAVDYPYESHDPAIRFMETVPICNSDKEKIYHLNAEELLGL